MKQQDNYTFLTTAPIPKVMLTSWFFPAHNPYNGLYFQRI